MKIKKGLYYALNMFLPLSEARYAKNNIVPSLKKQFQRINVARKLAQRQRRQPALTWQQAVDASGNSVARLEKTLLVRKRLFLLMGSLPVLFIIMLTLALLISGLHTPVLLIRSAIIIVIMAGLAAIPCLHAIVCTWRLWQLRERRVSVEERGTFRDWQQETRWIHNTLTPWR